MQRKVSFLMGSWSTPVPPQKLASGQPSFIGIRSFPLHLPTWLKGTSGGGGVCTHVQNHTHTITKRAGTDRRHSVVLPDSPWPSSLVTDGSPEAVEAFQPRTGDHRGRDPLHSPSEGASGPVQRSALPLFGADMDPVFFSSLAWRLVDPPPPELVPRLVGEEMARVKEGVGNKMITPPGRRLQATQTRVSLARCRRARGHLMRCRGKSRWGFTRRKCQPAPSPPGLHFKSLSVDERLDILLHVKWTVKACTPPHVSRGTWHT